MEYEDARRIRNKDYSLGRLITSNIRQGGGVGESIKGALKEKFDVGTRTKAKMTGIKEKFDPLNIAKFLTFGSNFAPALLGRMTGRSQKDINYFSGGNRAKPYENATKIGKLEGDESGLTDILDKIYTFMKKNQEDDIRHQELQNNYREEELAKDAKRHSDLLKALAKLTGNMGGKETAEKVSGEQGSPTDILSDILSAFGGLNTLKNVGGWLVRLALNPYILIPLLIAGGISYAIDSFKKNDEEQNRAAAKGDVETLRKKLESGLGDEAGMYANQDEMVKNALKKANTPESLAALKKMEEGERPKTSADKYDQFLADKGYYKSMGYKNLKGEMVPDDLKKAAEEYASGQTSTPSSAPPTPAPASESSSAPPTPAPASESSPASPASAEPAESSNAGQQLVNATNENNNAKLADLTSSPATNTVNSSQTNIGNKSSSSAQPLPPVRNLEDTFQRMIMNSTRVV